MARSDWGSLTKEPPLSSLDDTITAIRPGMSYGELLDFARAHTLGTAPGLIRKRFILVDDDETVVYDRFLQLVSEHGIHNRLVRKVMYFTWVYRDERIRRFICERIADKRGKWRIKQILNKNNANFFEQWLESGSAKKARSNIEFFLVECGLLNPHRREIHLELEDGWLVEAAIVVAQHERNALNKRKLLEDPGNYLIQKKLAGLVNATPIEIHGIDFPDSEDPSPLEDDAISVTPQKVREGRSWDRQLPKRSGKRSTTAVLDLVAKERASKSHYLLEKLLVESAQSLRIDPKFNEHIDLYFKTTKGMVLAEIKSANGKNYHSQIRKGVSQLLEYRFIYNNLLGSAPTLLLVIEIPPSRSKIWLSDYLKALGITLAWKDTQASRLVTNHAVPPALNGIVHSRRE